jgi:hypothetical protein
MATKRERKNVVVIWCLASITIFAIWLMVSSVFAAEVVSFKGTTKIASGDFVTLTGKLTKPQGDGPFPAVVLMHGCTGIAKNQDEWVERLASWGYVALQVDSHVANRISVIISFVSLLIFEPKMLMTLNLTLVDVHLWIAIG